MRSPTPDSEDLLALRSRAYRITLDGGRESFFALCIEEEDNDAAWLMSDTVSALDNCR